MFIYIFLFLPFAFAFNSGFPSRSELDKHHQVFSHGNIELALKQANADFFTPEAIQHIYFENFLRDSSQVIDTTGLKYFSRKTWTKLIGLYVKMNFKDIPIQVTEERLGLYRPEEHIDNPYGYDGIAAQKADSALRGPVETIEVAIDPQLGMKNYIASSKTGFKTSLDFIVDCLRQSKDAFHQNTLEESYRWMGKAFHALEDFYAHSNFLELYFIHRLNQQQVFPWVGPDTKVKIQQFPVREGGGDFVSVFPLVTGTFASLDAKVSTLSKLKDSLLELGVDHLIEKRDLEQEEVLNELIQLENELRQQEEQQQKMSQIQQLKKRGLFHHIKEAASNVFHKVEHVAGAVKDKLTDVAGGLANKAKNLIKKPAVWLLSKSLNELNEELNEQLEKQNSIFFQEPQSTNPTHSELSKDHFDHPLNELAGRCAQIAIVKISNLLVDVYHEQVSFDEVREMIWDVFTHPVQMKQHSGLHQALEQEIQSFYEKHADLLTLLDDQHARQNTEKLI